MTLTAACLALLLTSPPATNPAQQDEPIRINTRHFEFPLRYNEERKKDIAEAQLFVSWDRGQTWVRIARAKPDATSITVKEKRDGLAWYTLQVIDRNGKQDPADLGKSSAIQKVLIESGTAERPARKLDPTKDEPAALRARIAELQRLLRDLEERLHEAEKPKPR